MKVQILILFTLASFVITATAFSQISENDEKPERPVRSPFESTLLLEKQTTKTNSAKTLQMVMQHRFGNITGEGFDLLGIYGASNIRIGFNYSILDQLQIGIGTTKNKLLQDASVKYAIFKQTMSNSMPVALTYYGMASMETLDEENYKNFTHRLAYFHELMMSRKFNRWLTLQVHVNYSHFNAVDSSSFIPPGESEAVKHDRNHDNIGVGMIGRVKISPQASILFEYDHLITSPDVDAAKPNISVGYEVRTSAHTFQITLGSYKAILPHYNLVYNTNDFLETDLFLGFNITRLWNF